MKEYTKKTINYYDNIANSYINSSSAVVLKDKIDKFIELLHGKRILDVGCGPGHDTDYLTRMGFDCLGIDLSEKMIEIARQNHKGRFEVMDFLGLKFESNSFDGMWCSSVFTHIKKDDLPTFLTSSRKFIRNDGILGIIATEKQKKIRNSNDTRLYTMFSEKELGNYLKKAGYEILVSEIFPYGGKSRIFIIVRN